MLFIARKWYVLQAPAASVVVEGGYNPSLLTAAVKYEWRGKLFWEENVRQEKVRLLLIYRSMNTERVANIVVKD